MRPITLRRVVEVCRLVKNGKTSIQKIRDVLELSKSRATEVTLELQVMNLITINNNDCESNKNTLLFLESFEKENWVNLHSYFITNYSFYRTFIDLLAQHLDADHGMSLDFIQKEVERLNLNLNRTSIEVLTDWCDRLGICQRHLYSGHIYLLKPTEPNRTEFREKLVECFDMLINDRKPQEVFAEIPRVREDVCEKCRIRRDAFDNMLTQLYLQNIGKIELCGAPITTMAKKSPLSEKKIKPYSKNGVLAPKFLLKKEREGLTIKNKSYFYIAIYGNLMHA